ncbi:MAG: glutamate synthase large subunit [Clostridia bacterium]|nr:glutamate synthase large subunit [Clostridia bacterium]
MKKTGLYDPAFEHDSCGIGAVVDIKGRADHKIVDDALKIVEKLEHRAGKDATGDTGDGVGILTSVPHKFFKKQIPQLGDRGEYGVGMFFFPNDSLKRNQAKKMLELIVEKENLRFLCWREVPVRAETLGKKARDCMPSIWQCFVEKPSQDKTALAFDRRLYIARREFEQCNDNTYVASFSSRTIVYKGMFLVGQLRSFYPDLTDRDYEACIATVHSRFSTNTFPSWNRAHPNRIMLHNGEINTIRGNYDRMAAREETMSSDLLGENMEKVLPVISSDGSDSAMLDNTLEFMMMNGIDLPLAVMILIPEPWRDDATISQKVKDMYHYYATMMEPWDGPASILFTDGDVVGAVLDRNGLRPSRYLITRDDRLILASEVGVVDIPDADIVLKSRLQPGRMLLVDTKAGRVIGDGEIKARYAAECPYGEWLDRNLMKFGDIPVPNKRVEIHDQRLRDRLYKAFGYTYEDVKDVILPMAANASEPTASMGADIPLAVLSDKHQPLFCYFKQLFAQVTNPPIDAIREKIVTDTTVYVGSDGNLLSKREDNCRVLEIDNPIITSVELMRIKTLDKPGLCAKTVSLLYYKNTPLERAVERLFLNCDRMVRAGGNIIILSDRGVDENHVAIPSLLAVSALEQYLIRTKKRTAVSVILESAEPRDVHHFALLLGYGARAVNPYLAHECIGEIIEKGMLDKDEHEAIDAYNRAVLSGIVKIASKMGIATIQSYQSAQVFEIVGIKKDVVDKYFTNTVSRVGGIGLVEIGEDVEYRHDQAFDPLGLPLDETLDSGGFHKLRSSTDAQEHLYNPMSIALLRESTRKGDYELFKQYSKLIDDEGCPKTLRSLMTFDFDPKNSVPLDEVEPVESIVKRFKTGAMSYGSISQEAHECMAKAMNMLGGKSNSGEGGEDEERFSTDKCSAIKQVASGRFGVTSEYLLSAREIQIKMAQGAKPGEGGHLPGKKVYPWIAKTRHATPGVSLISPPPHHDIYSIEDLAQLIYDLKNVNRDARISVKLVSEAGVGTIAAGVAKAGAQVILISGYDGGTGAAPRTSIHDAGLPWELGVSETHQTLCLNGLRSRVTIETDGKLMTGRDIAIACMLGAEEFGFATAPLVTMGCVMMRVCNLDTCPVGIATQNPILRKRFSGKPEYIVNFMRFIAMQLREIMAMAGVRTVEQLVGRSDLLKKRDFTPGSRMDLVDLSGILHKAVGDESHFVKEKVYDFHLERTVDCKKLAGQVMPKLAIGEKARVTTRVSSTDRTFGAILGSEITKKYAMSLDEDACIVKCEGGGGQSFGAFIPKGLTLELEGDANDYFGKGLSGGTLIAYPPKASTFSTHDNVIIGNVALYGATSGKAFINGMAGERFCVRNSGAMAVVEGVGDHGCEYMTGGVAAILGPTGKNFAAGMSGGVAYVLDENHDLYTRLNKELVFSLALEEDDDIAQLKDMLEQHARLTGSEKARAILKDFDACLGSFKKIIPREYSRIIKAMSREAI